MEETGYAILMFVFGGLLLLYSLVLMKRQNYHDLPYRGRTAAKGWNTKEHVRKIGVIVFCMSFAPILSAVCALLFEPMLIAIIVLFAGFIVGLILCSRWYYSKEDDK